MSDLIISTGELRAKAQKIDNNNKSLDTALNNCKTEVKKLDANWQSDASTEIIKQMDSLSKRFEDYKTILSEYVSFLQRTAEAYEGNEDTLQKNASNINEFK